MNALAKVYDLDTSQPDCTWIVIRRKPSEVPHAIDWELIQIAGMSEMDGPNNRVSYRFMTPERAAQAERFLNGCGWERSP